MRVRVELNVYKTEDYKKKRTMRARLEENEEAIMDKRNDLISEIKKRMGTSTELTELFTIEWEVI